MKKVGLLKKKLPYEIEEEINTLRTNIQFTGTDKKVILITSCLGNEGKSTMSFNLACSMAEMGKQVLFIDSDMRKSVFVKRVTQGEVDKGLSHFLSGQCSLSDAVYATNIPNLHAIFAGPVPPNPTELLETELFRDTVTSCRSLYDYIIIDTAPLGMVIDAAIVAKACDGSVILLEAGNSKYKIAQDVKAKLEAAKCPILGAVLNKVDIAGQGYYYKQYYKKYEKYGETS